MSDLERRVAESLSRLPHPADEVTERARRLALDALPPPKRSRRRAILVPVVAALCAGIAGAALAAAGGLTLTDEPAVQAAPDPPVGVLRLPPGVSGVAVLADGRVRSRTKAGFAIEGMGATAVELSPNALYLAAGIGSSVVALRPSGSQVWTQKTAGPVVSIAWAPNPQPIHVAYVVRVGRRHDLRLIEGDGDNDRLVATDVGAARPTWRGDSLRLWFRDREGKPAGYDLASGRILGSDDVPMPATATTPPALKQALDSIRPGARIQAVADTSKGAAVALSVPATGSDRAATELWWSPEAGDEPPVAILRLPGPPRERVYLSVR